MKALGYSQRSEPVWGTYFVQVVILLQVDGLREPFTLANGALLSMDALIAKAGDISLSREATTQAVIKA